MTAQRRRDILAEVADIVAVDRNASYGEPEDNFAVIAEFWEVYLRHKRSPGVTAEDVAIMQILLKVARLANDPHHHDGAVDIAGYAACLGDIAATFVERADVSGNGVPDRLCAEEAVAKM